MRWWGLIPAILAVGVVLAQPAPDPVFPYGAVYFRKSNPPESDWARDHKTAAEAGMNIFRHWVMWSAVEVSPGVYDWKDYDRIMDLQAANGIRAVLAEMLTAAPEWAYRMYPDAAMEAHDGHKSISGYSGSSATGGFPGLCLDHPKVRAHAEKFLRALAERYRDHPAMFGYDLWNEGNGWHGAGGFVQSASSAHIPNERRSTPAGRIYDYNPHVQEKFRTWLKAKYGNLETLGKAWRRYSFATWDNVQAPRAGGPYADWLDWIEFREDHAHEQLRWRRETIRSADKKNKITMHGLAYSIEYLPQYSANDWRAAKEVEIYGFTWIHARKGSQPWKQFHAVDMIRGASRGKPFWHAEFQGGPLWMQAEVLNRPLDDGRKPDEKDLRIWNMVSFSGGISGLLYLRWRPLLEGPLFGAFGPFAMDGSHTPRSRMASRLAKWANANPSLWTSKPVRGDVAIVFVPEAERFNFAQQGNTSHYAESARGAYMAFFDSNIQPDWVHVDHIEEYPVVYLPYPVMLKSTTVAKLRNYVLNGGTLISEGLPGYFDERARAGTHQPHQGLDSLFGARELDVEFAPDLFTALEWNYDEHRIGGRFFRQVYEATSGKVVGRYGDGSAAAIELQSGRGRTILFGTFPGAAYFHHQQPGTRTLFRQLLGGIQQVAVNDLAVKARLHDGEGGKVLWVLNPTRQARTVTVQLKDGNFSGASDLWGGLEAQVDGQRITVTLPERDAAVLKLN